ncbi:hypothetical protein L6452_22745 [Arctium lappa]|uniref:Uncharacterized protein n=1 Tax=Arctium lappa TaxID=4217 RepID=A0ACB9B2D2_ARCLA|nr:hypothetical protein L6452_22745 [Arctium lappa]
MDATLILPNVPPGFKSFSRSNDRSNNKIRHRFRCRISAIVEVSAITSDPIAPQITWQIVVGSIGWDNSGFDFEIAAGVAPFMVAGIEFSK